MAARPIVSVCCQMLSVGWIFDSLLTATILPLIAWPSEDCEHSYQDLRVDYVYVPLIADVITWINHSIKLTLCFELFTLVLRRLPEEPPYEFSL